MIIKFKEITQTHVTLLYFSLELQEHIITSGRSQIKTRKFIFVLLYFKKNCARRIQNRAYAAERELCPGVFPCFKYVGVGAGLGVELED